MIAHATDEVPAAVSPDKPSDAESAPVEPYEPLLKAVAEWFSSVEHYWSARTDLVRVQVRKAVVAAVLAAITVASILVAIVASIWLLVSGIAAGLTEAWGGRIWAGNLTAGLLIPLVLIGWFLLRARRRSLVMHRRKVDQYERRREAHPEAFGRDFAQRKEK
jgi:hypothetical protein